MRRSACHLHGCRRLVAVTIEQRYPDGEKVLIDLCRPCAAKWLKNRPETARKVRESGSQVTLPPLAARATRGTEGGSGL